MFDSYEREFIRGVLADPHSAAPRLAYAEWLEKADDARAPAVRLGVKILNAERERFDIDSDSQLQLWRKDLRNLNLDYSAACRKHLPQFEGVRWRGFDGGVVEQVLIEDPNAFRKCVGQMLDVQPLHRLEFTSEIESDYCTLLDSPELSRLGALQMGGGYQGPAIATAVAQSTHLNQLHSLNLAFASIADEGAIQLANAAHLSTLTELALERCELTDVGLKALLAAPQFSQVERLGLGWNDLGCDAVELLCKSPLRKVRHLDLHSNVQIGVDAIRQLADSDWLNSIEWLNLAHCNLAPSAFESILNGACPELKRLNLRGNRCDESTVRLLADSDLPNLQDLSIEISGDIAASVCESFAAASWLDNLQRFAVTGDDAIADLLLEIFSNASLNNLEQLCVYGYDDKSQSFDQTITQLAANPTLKRLTVFEAQQPLNEQAIESLASMHSLEYLFAPQDHIEDLSNALPSCRVSTFS